MTVEKNYYFSVDEMNLILASLQERPYKEVYQIISNIHTQYETSEECKRLAEEHDTK